MTLRDHARQIISQTIQSVLPNNAVRKALEKIDLEAAHLYLVAIGKAAWPMADMAANVLADKLTKGILITKYDHIEGPIDKVEAYEAGHPISDDNTYHATQKVLDMVSDLGPDDLVIFLVSGGGSALFEKPAIESKLLEKINADLLASGANIKEINSIRKRLSKVKGGRFAQFVWPARIEAIVLSDVLGDRLDMIASGPAYPDSTTKEDVYEIIDKYDLDIDPRVKEFLDQETPKEIVNANHHIIGSVRELVLRAKEEAEKLGYASLILTDHLDGLAKETGYMLANIARYYHNQGPLAIIAGGETVVEITGDGKGGRNQEIALAAAEKIAGLDNVLVFSVGSDGTDGPTDAAGGMVDGQSKERLENKGKSIDQVLQANDSYHALKDIDGLIMTGPTGTNVNDFCVVLIQ